MKKTRIVMMVEGPIGSAELNPADVDRVMESFVGVLVALGSRVTFSSVQTDGGVLRQITAGRDVETMALVADTLAALCGPLVAGVEPVAEELPTESVVETGDSSASQVIQEGWAGDPVDGAGLVVPEGASMAAKRGRPKKEK